MKSIKNLMKSVAVMLLVTLGMATTFTSCTEEEKAVLFYMFESGDVQFGSAEDEAIVDAVNDYLEAQGFFGQLIETSVPHLDVTDEDIAATASDTANRILDRLQGIDFMQVLSDAGVTYTPGRADLTIIFRLYLVTMNGDVMDDFQVPFTISFR